jgi:lysophospholipase L1-like esterase
MDKILIFGDSIAHGNNDWEDGGWVGRLQTSLPDVEVRNLSIDGATTEDVLRIIRLKIKEFEGKITVIFAIGINDSALLRPRMAPMVAEEQFISNLERMVDEARMFAEKIVFVGLTNVDESKTRPVEWEPDIFYSNVEIKRYNSLLKSFVEKHNLTFVDVFEKLAREEIDDGVHPNAAGHERLFSIVDEVIKFIKL